MTTRTTAGCIHRAVDVAIALVLGIGTLPLLLVASTASALAYRTTPFFVHERIGRHGRAFRFVKIRTLPPSTPRYADKFEIAEAAVPRSMQWLRRVHLDELPQLWLVVTGRMSIVGPRPEMAALHHRIPPRAAEERLRVRPGITGLWQISVHCDGLICDRPEYDQLYVRHRSMLLDTWILLESARKMVLGRRVHLFEVPLWAIGRDGRPQRSALAAPPTPASGSGPAAEVDVDEQAAALASI